VISSHETVGGKGFEQARIFSGPDGLLHLTATEYDHHTGGTQPHFISNPAGRSAANISGLVWELVEKFNDWGAEPGPHELTPVYPANSKPPPGDGEPDSAPEYFIQFASSPYRIDLMKVRWVNVSREEV
jgi:hypothetical protein